MTNGAAAGGAAAAAAAISNAIKASGAIVQIDPWDFQELVARMEQPLVVYKEASFWSGYRYLTCYKGLYFFAKCKEALRLTGDIELIQAKSIWVPS